MKRNSKGVTPEFTGLWGPGSCGDDKLEGVTAVTAPFRVWVGGTKKGMAIPSPLNGETDMQGVP